MGSIKKMVWNVFYKITGNLASLFTERTAIMPAFALKRKLPVNMPASDLIYFENEVYKDFNPVTEVRVKNVHLVVNEGVVIKCLSIIDESLMDPLAKGWFGLSYLLKPYTSAIKLKHDKYLMVYNHYGVGYGHWLVDVLPRLYIKRKQLRGYKILLPANYNTFHVKTLAPLGITLDDIVFLDNDKAYSVPDITILSHVGTTCNTKDEILQEMRQYYLDFYVGVSKVEPFRRLYISRVGVKNRVVVNEMEVEALALANGFEIMHPQNYTFEQQIKLFSECKVMMGLTGSGLTNILFMPQGGSIIEFKMEGDHQNLHYFSMTSAMQLDYYYMLCKTQGDDRFTANFIVDVDKLGQILETLI